MKEGFRIRTKYRIKIWIDKLGMRKDSNIDYHFSCVPPDKFFDKCSHTDAVLVISEKMRDFAEKKIANQAIYIEIDDYFTGQAYATNHVVLTNKDKDWTMDYTKDGKWSTLRFPLPFKPPFKL